MGHRWLGFRNFFLQRRTAYVCMMKDLLHISLPSTTFMLPKGRAPSVLSPSPSPRLVVAMSNFFRMKHSGCEVKIIETLDLYNSFVVLG